MTGRHAEGIEQELKAKIHFDRNVFVVYFSVPIGVDGFLARLKDACKLGTDANITVKVIDDEGEHISLLQEFRVANLVENSAHTSNF